MGSQKVRTTFAGAYGILTSTDVSPCWDSQFTSRRTHGASAQWCSEPEEMSILSSVMGITQEVSNPVVLIYHDDLTES
jgi:hypothetical protein